MDITTTPANTAIQASNPAGLRAALARFTGTSIWYRHPIFRDLLTTEGVQYLATHAGAQWLIDAIAAVQLAKPAVRAEDFQVWTLKVNPDHSAILICTDGNGQTLFRAEISWTDFPLDGIDLWYANNTIYLPSEH